MPRMGQDRFEPFKIVIFMKGSEKVSKVKLSSYGIKNRGECSMRCLKWGVFTGERTFTRVAALLLAFLVLDLAGFTLAAEEIKGEETIGRIILLDTAANMVTIQTKQGEMSFYVYEKTQITMAKEAKLFSDLRMGEKVKVYYIISEGKELAERVIVKPPKKKRSPIGSLDP